MKLGDFITLQRGFDLPEKDRKPGKVPVISSSGIFFYHNTVAVRGPGVVTGRYGTIGKVFFIEDDFWPLNTTLFVKDFHGNDPLFASYLLRTIDFTSCSDKSSVPGVNRNDLHLLSVLIPSYATQRTIARILSSFDDKIKLNQQINKTLEAMARTIFQSWFVDFDPVRAKADGRQPEGMDAATMALFPSGFEEIEGSEVPKGWVVGSLSDIINLVGGGTPKTTVEEYWNGDIPWFSVVDAPQESDVFVIDTEKHITQSGIENSSTNILPVGTTIISARGTVGTLALVGTPMAMNQSCYGVRGKAGYSDYFVHFQLRRAITDLQQQTHGTVFETITRQTFDGVKIIIPPDEIAQKFDQIVCGDLEKIRKNLLESRTLATLRDVMLPKLMSGEIPV